MLSTAEPLISRQPRLLWGRFKEYRPARVTMPGSARLTTRLRGKYLKLSVGSGIESMVSMESIPFDRSELPMELPTDRLASSPTGSRSLSR